MVQVVKDPLGTKGARLTTDITLPSRYLVFMPGASHVGVSQRIESESERERLKKVVAEYCDEQGGFIIRTAAEGVGEAELASDARSIRNASGRKLWSVKNARRPVISCTANWRWRSVFCVISPTPNWTAFALTHARIALPEFTSEYIPEMTSKLGALHRTPADFRSL